MPSDAASSRTPAHINQIVDGLRRAEATLSAEKRLLELVARGVAPPDVLDALCRQVEALAPGCACSILLVDRDAQAFRIGAAPSLPDDYRAHLDGKSLYPNDGPFALALQTGAAVVAADIVEDARWAGSIWPGLMAAAGFRACSSTPILVAGAAVEAVFALFHREPGPPSAIEQELVDRFASIAGIALEHARSAEALVRARSDLEQAYNFLNQAQRLSRTGSFTFHADPTKQIWSDEMYRILGLPPGMTVSTIDARAMIHPDDLDAYDAMVARGLAGEQMDATYRIVTPDGVVKYTHTVAYGLPQVEGGPSYLGATQDVTETKLAEEALKASESQLRRANLYLTQAQGLSKTGSYARKMPTDAQDLSDEMFRIWEFDPTAPVTHEMVRARIHPEDLAAFDAAQAAALAAGDDFRFAYRIVTPRDGLKHLRTISRRNEEGQGEVVYVGATQDVTETKLAEEALRAREAELRLANRYLTTAQSVSQTGSFTWDMTRDEHSWSEETYRIWEFDPTAPVSIDLILSAIHPEDMPMIEAAMAGAARGEGFDIVFRIITPKGTLKHIHGVAQRMEQITDRIVYVGATQDVTESRRAGEALDLARAELAHVARLATLSTLTAAIAHEVNQPLAGIVTNASTCLRMLAADPPNLEGARATAQRTIRDASRAAEVITRLRALFSNRPAAHEQVDLNDAVREVFALAASELQRARVTLRANLADDLPPVSGDRVQLQQVILNLLLNAADAMRDVGDRTRELTVATSLDADDLVRLSVRDAGVGLTPDLAEKLFEPFHTTKPAGMGIGLSISRSIIESHDGRLWAEPNEGPGATFAFALPTHSDDEDPEEGRPVAGQS